MGLSCGLVLFPYMRARAKADLSHEYCQISGGHLIDLKVSHFTTDGELGYSRWNLKEELWMCQVLSSYVEINKSQAHSLQ